MGQIVSAAAKPKRCNIQSLSSLDTPAAGEHILVSSDNSMNAAGQGNFDCYIEGDGTKAATALPLLTIADDTITRDSLNSVTSKAIFPLKEAIFGSSGNIYPSVGQRGDGYFLTSPTLASPTGGYYYIIDLSAYVGAQVVVNFTTSNTTSTRATGIGNASAFSTYYKEMQLANNEVENFTFNITSSAYILYISFSTNIDTSTLSVVVTGYTVEGMISRVNTLQTIIDGSEEELDITSLINFDGTGIIWASNKSVGQTYTGATDGATGGIYNTTPFDLSPYTQITLYSIVTGNRAIILTDDNDKIVAVSRWGDNNTWTYDIHALNAKNLWVCITDNDRNFSAVGSIKVEGIEERVDALENQSGGDKSVVYVSESGNDGNEGTASSPLATIDAALSLGAEVVYVDGIVSGQVNLSLCKGRQLRIEKKTNGNVSVLHDNSAIVLSDGSEELVSGKVYRKVLTSTISSATKWIYQEFVNDETTLISDVDRLPLQRGQEYRCKHTRLTLTSATSLNDAISEIQSADDYRWFFDASNSTLYFSRPQTTSASHPLIIPKELKMLFASTNKNVKLTMVGIDVIGMAVNIHEMNAPTLIECSSGCVSGNGISWNDTIGARIVRCEAYFCQYAANGDGFNAHATFSAGVNVFERYCYAELVDCWAHDIYDDGYSDHGRCEVSIFGGLFEHCGKGAITPSNGTHCTCYNVIARNSIRGFYLAGVDNNEGGHYAQLKCIGCSSYNNHKSNGAGGFGYSVVSNGNKLTAINCSGWNNEDRSYHCDASTQMLLVDCKSSGDGASSPVYKGGSVQIVNNNSIS